MIRRTAGKSKVCFIGRMEVQWGDYSVVEAELKLLHAAVAENYQYFYRISGMDLPLKPQAEIHVFLIGTSVKNLSNFSTIVFLQVLSGKNEFCIRIDSMIVQKVKNAYLN